MGAGLKSFGNYLTKAVPEKLITSGLLNPAKLRTVNNQLKALGEKELTGVGAASRWMLRHNVKGKAEDIVQQLDDIAVKNKTSLDDALASIDKKIHNESITNALDVLSSKLGKATEGQPLAAKKLITDMLSRVDDGFTLTEINQIKRFSDDFLNIYTDL